MTRSNAPAAMPFSAFFAFSSGIGQFRPGHIEQNGDCFRSRFGHCARSLVGTVCEYCTDLARLPRRNFLTRVVSLRLQAPRFGAGLNGDRTNFSIMHTMRLSPQIRLLDRHRPQLVDQRRRHGQQRVAGTRRQFVGRGVARNGTGDRQTAAAAGARRGTDGQRSAAEVLHGDATLQPRRTLGIEAQTVVSGVDRRPGNQRFAAPGGVIGINLGLYLAAEDVERILGGARTRTRAPEPAPLRAADRNAAAVGDSVSRGDARVDRHCRHRGRRRRARGDVRHSGSSHSRTNCSSSREREAEADRIGINTLAAADLDPAAMGKMFEQMQRAYRFSRRPPEFLLTHPVSEARISDARNQASEYPAKTYPDSEEFQMMRARAMVHYAPSPQQAVAAVQRHSSNAPTARTGRTTA